MVRGWVVVVLTSMMDNYDGGSIEKPTEQCNAADCVVGGAAACVTNHGSGETGTEVVLGDAAGVEAGH